MAEWLLPFQGRKSSGPFNQNFLWRQGSTYIMDNHRAALWCWLQHVDLKSPHSIFHLDRHPDTLQSRMDQWLTHLPATWDISLEDYLNRSYPVEHTHNLPLFSWDNYMSIYLAVFGSSLKTCYFATHRDGDKPNYETTHIEMWDIPENLDFWLGTSGSPWIMNVDLDYFFWDDSEHPDLMVSDKYIERVFEVIRKKICSQTIAVTTIALTPDEALTGGWTSSERLASQALQVLGLNFQLPGYSFS